LFYYVAGAAVLPHFGTTELLLTCSDIIYAEHFISRNRMTMYIDNYNFGRIVINNKTSSLDVIVYPGRVGPSWRRKEGSI